MIPFDAAVNVVAAAIMKDCPPWMLGEAAEAQPEATREVALVAVKAVNPLILARSQEALNVALDALRRSADDHNCDYCRADIAAVERVMRGE